MNLKNMFNFGYKRTFFEALAFYVFWCLLITLFVLILSAVCTFCYFIFFDVFNLIKLPWITMRHIIIGGLSGYLTTLICLLITFLIIDRKKVYNFWSILLFLVTIFSCFFVRGALIGFIFTSILTMFPSKKQLNIEN